MDYLVKFVNSATRAPITGLTPTWTSLVKVSDGTAYTPQPAISELGIGYYKFTFAPAVDLVGRVDGGAALALSDRYVEVSAGPADAYLDASVAAIPTLQQIRDGITTDHGAGAYNIVDTGDAAEGLSLTVQLYLTATTTPIPDVTVTLLNSTQTVFLSSKVSDSNGRVTFTVNPGTYKIRRHKAGYAFADPDTAVLTTVDVTLNSYGGAYVPAASADPDTQILSGVHVLGSGVPIAGRTVKATPVAGQVIPSVTIDKQKLTDTTDVSTGAWSLELLRGVVYDIEIQGWGSKVITITTDAGKDFSTY